MNERDRCNTCKGKKVVNETKILEVPVDKGMKDGKKIYFRGEGDQLVIIVDDNITLDLSLFYYVCIYLFVLCLSFHYSISAWRRSWRRHNRRNSDTSRKIPTSR